MATTTAKRAPKRSRKAPAGALKLTLTINEGQCGDGCGEAVAKGRSYRQGHDAKLRSKLLDAFRAGETQVGVVRDGRLTTYSIASVLDVHNWKVPSKISKAA